LAETTATFHSLGPNTSSTLVTSIVTQPAEVAPKMTEITQCP